jgi:hypothetical protein
MTATPTEWVEALSLALMACGTVSVPYFLLFVDADPADFDPRPTARRLLDTDAGARLLVETVRARYTLTALALALSLRLAVPAGGTR